MPSLRLIYYTHIQQVSHPVIKVGKSGKKFEQTIATYKYLIALRFVCTRPIWHFPAASRRCI